MCSRALAPYLQILRKLYTPTTPPIRGRHCDRTLHAIKITKMESYSYHRNNTRERNMGLKILTSLINKTTQIIKIKKKFKSYSQ